jgi:hypothetical protein
MSQGKGNDDGTGRMRYEKSHPWSFTEPSGINLEGGCDCPRNAFGFKAGCEHIGTKRQTYPRQKSWRSGGF